MDWLSALRFANIFGGGSNPAMMGTDLPSQGGITGNMGMPTQINPAIMGPPPPGPPSDMPVSAGLPTVDDTMGPPPFIPSHSAQDAYDAMIKQYPTDRGHGKLARLGAAIAGGLQTYNTGDIAKGYLFGKSILDEQHNSDIQEWKDKIGPLQHAAEIERQENQYGANNQVRREGQAITKEKNDQTAASNKGKLEVSQGRLKLQEMKAAKKNIKFDFSGPEVLASDPETGIVTKTGVMTGNLSDQDKIDLQGEKRIEQIREAGDQTRQTAVTRGWDIKDIQDPNDPTKRISVRINQDTGDIQPINYQGMPTQVTKPGAPNPAADKEQKMQVVRQKAQDALDSLGDLLGDDDQLKDNVKTVVGKSRIFGTQMIPGTKARSAEVAINNFKANQVLSVIAEMKAQSRTGATGFGALNARELTVLEQAANKLDPAMDEEDFRKELVKIKDKLKKVLQPENGMSPTNVTTKKTPQQLWDENQ